MASIFSAALDRTVARLARCLGADRVPLPVAILTLCQPNARLVSRRPLTREELIARGTQRR